MRRRTTSLATSSGFTLIELLVTLVIIGVLSTVALISVAKNENERQIDEFAAAITAAMREARSRAMNRRVRYCVYLTRTSVWWCERSCPPLPNWQRGVRYWAPRSGPRAIRWANVADFNLRNMPSTHVMYAKRIYFLPDGTMDANLNTLQKEGFTVYLDHVKDRNLKRRIVVLPLSGQIRTFLSW